MNTCTILLPRISQEQIDRILNGAAYVLWPTLAPMIHDMLMRRR